MTEKLPFTKAQNCKSVIKDTIVEIADEHFWRVKLTDNPDTHLLSADIDPKNWKIHFNITADAESSLLVRGIDLEAQKLLARGVVLHEIGHWGYCPYDKQGQYRIVNAVGSVIASHHQTRKKSPNIQQNFIMLLCNLVADLIVDTVQAWQDDTGEYADGQALFMIKELRSPVGRTHHLYAAFVQLNLLLFGEKSSYSNDVKEALHLFGPNLTIRVPSDLEKIFPNYGNPRRLIVWLQGQDNWPGLAKRLARFFLQFNLDAFMAKKPVDGRTNAFQEGLGVLYEGRAQEIPVVARGESCGVNEVEIAPLVNRVIDPLSMPDVGKIDWSATRCLPGFQAKPQLQLNYTEQSILHPDRPSQGTGLMMDLSFWIDSSGSMNWDAYAGTGEYDLLLRAIFGVLFWLEKKQIAPYLNYSVLNFSCRTVSSGWQNWQQRKYIHSALLDYQGGITLLSIRKVKALVRSARRFFLTIMVTDGEISSHQDLVAFIEQSIAVKERFVLIQLGKMTEFSTAIKELGCQVHCISSPADLQHLMLKEVSKKYVI